MNEKGQNFFPESPEPLPVPEPHFCVCSKGVITCPPHLLVWGKIRCGPIGHLHVRCHRGWSEVLGGIQGVGLHVSGGQGLPWTVPWVPAVVSPGLAFRKQGVSPCPLRPGPPSSLLCFLVRVGPACLIWTAPGPRAPTPLSRLPARAALSRFLPTCSHASPFFSSSACRLPFLPREDPELPPSPLLPLSDATLHLCCPSALSLLPGLPGSIVSGCLGVSSPRMPTPNHGAGMWAARGKVCELKLPVPIIQVRKWRQERGAGGPVPRGSPTEGHAVAQLPCHREGTLNSRGGSLHPCQHLGPQVCPCLRQRVDGSGLAGPWIAEVDFLVKAVKSCTILAPALAPQTRGSVDVGWR